MRYIRNSDLSGRQGRLLFVLLSVMPGFFADNKKTEEKWGGKKAIKTLIRKMRTIYKSYAALFVKNIFKNNRGKIHKNPGHAPY